MADYRQKWDEALAVIREGLPEKEFSDWFEPIAFESYTPSTRQVLLQVPGRGHIEHIEANHIRLLGKALIPVFGKNVRLGYRIVVAGSKVTEESDKELVKERAYQTRGESQLPEVDPQLDPQMNFNTFIEGDSNRLSRSVGLNIAEHPKGTKFNPMFIYGPPGCGKTHLINAIGLRTKEMYPKKRVLYVSARTFEQQFTTAIQNGHNNDFIAFYQTLDVLIVDDIQEWMGKKGTQNSFFHIFDDLFRHQKRIILACDRSPSQLHDMHERLVTRFICGVTCEVLKPNVELCRDILKSKIKRDGLEITDDVIQYIAEHVNGSVRDLQGVINSLMVYSIVDNVEINVKLAERIIHKVVHVNQADISVDAITDAVCSAFNVKVQDLMGPGRKKDIAIARHIAIYLTSRLTGMQTTRIGRLFGNRNHSTVINSISKAEQLLAKDSKLRETVDKIEKGIKD